MNSITDKYLDRFWGKVDKYSSNIFYNKERCWIWNGARNENGYGHIKIEGKDEYAHRVSWIISNGEISHKLNILHHCDNPSCVNPEHLFLGTQKDNAEDRENKGRGNHPKGDNSGARLHPETHARGERHGSAKLNWNQVREIRRRYKFQGIGGDNSITLSKEFGVSSKTISSIVNNELWKE